MRSYMHQTILIKTLFFFLLIVACLSLLHCTEEKKTKHREQKNYQNQSKNFFKATQKNNRKKTFPRLIETRNSFYLISPTQAK